MVHLLAIDIRALWGQVGNEPFSAVVDTDDPVAHDQVRTGLLTPFYKHDQS
ncbi:hypothetical protein [Actinocorallia libanotica]|uniref:hypothetical protein n=1 Tax=Actinocorallia libanotica TaxID=46162 RepID=UPI0031D4A95C